MQIKLKKLIHQALIMTVRITDWYFPYKLPIATVCLLKPLSITNNISKAVETRKKQKAG